MELADAVDLGNVDTSAADKVAPKLDAPAAAVDVLQATEAEKWAAAPELFYSLVEDELPELKSVYTPERCARWGEAMVPIAKKFGWTADDAFKWLGDWAMFVIASHRLVTPTAKAIAVRVRQYREAALKEQGPQPDKPA